MTDQEAYDLWARLQQLERDIQSINQRAGIDTFDIINVQMEQLRRSSWTVRLAIQSQASNIILDDLKLPEVMRRSTDINVKPA